MWTPCGGKLYMPTAGFHACYGQIDVHIFVLQPLTRIILEMKDMVSYHYTNSTYSRSTVDRLTVDRSTVHRSTHCLFCLDVYLLSTYIYQKLSTCQLSTCQPFISHITFTNRFTHFHISILPHFMILLYLGVTIPEPFCPYCAIN